MQSHLQTLAVNSLTYDFKKPHCRCAGQNNRDIIYYNRLKNHDSICHMQTLSPVDAL